MVVAESRSRRSTFEDMIRLDTEGNWYQGDFPILHDRTCQFFYKHIALDDEGRYYLQGEEKPVYINVEDVPYWITKLERTIAGYLITLTDESIELLDLHSLWSGKKNALYSRVKGGRFPAKFMRGPYYEVTKDLTQKGDKFFLMFRGKAYPISPVPPKDLIPAERKPKEKVSSKKAKSRGGSAGREKMSSKKHVRPIKKAAKKKSIRKRR